MGERVRVSGVLCTGELQYARSLQKDMVVGEGLVDRRKDFLGHGRANGDVVASIGKDLRLNDGDQAVLLADAGIARQAIGVLVDAQIRRASGGLINLQNSTPLGEARTGLVILGTPGTEVVNSLRLSLAVGSGELDDTLVDFDARDNVLGVEHLDERRAVVGALVEGLLEQDDARDALRDALAGEEHLPEVPSGRLGILNTDGGQALANRPGRFVCRQDALPGGNNGAGCGDELVRVLVGERVAGYGTWASKQ